jgi:threonyl-tRNA synthetase
VREHSLAKVPVIAVVGRKEAETGQLALRRLGSDRQAILTLDAAAEGLLREALPPDLAPPPAPPEADARAMEDA